MQKVYQRINWENEPSEATPLNERNLNKIDYALNEIDNRVIEYAHYKDDAAASAQAAAQSATASANSATASANSATASATSAAASKVSEDNAKVSETNASQSATNAAQSESNASASASNAATSEAAADNWNKLSESHNHGGTGARAGEDEDNSEYWSIQSHNYSDAAAESETNAAQSAVSARTDANDAAVILEQVRSYSAIIIPSFLLDVDSGKLYISDDAVGVDFKIDEDTCKLYYKFIS